MKLTDYAKDIGISYRTAWRHFHKGYIANAYQLPSGTIIIPENKKDKKENCVAVYSRVSSSQNKNNLESQAKRVSDYCAAKGYKICRVVKEIGSGVNDSRKQFISLLKDNTIDIIVVEHKDRATRFGFNYIEQMLSMQGRKIEVINQTNTDKEELMNDLISIITSFVARYYGSRRSKRKTEKVIKELRNND